MRQRKEKERGEDKKKEKKKWRINSKKVFSNFLLLGRNQCLTAQVGYSRDEKKLFPYS